jgi:hypothetical protein
VVPAPATTVTDVTTDTAGDTVSFHVSKIGTPVLVKVSYFPNWQATGAEGPWRVAPNLMVVVPTAHDVTMHYGKSRADELGLAATVLGVLALVALAVWPRWRRRRRPRHSHASHARRSHGPATDDPAWPTRSSA